MGREKLGEVRDMLGDPRGGPDQVGGLSGRSGTGRVTLGEDRDGSGDPSEFLRRIIGP